MMKLSRKSKQAEDEDLKDAIEVGPEVVKDKGITMQMKVMDYWR